MTAEIEFITSPERVNLGNFEDDNKYCVKSPFQKITGNETLVRIRMDGKLFSVLSCGGNTRCFDFWWGLLLLIWEMMSMLLTLPPFITFCLFQFVTFFHH